MKNTRLKSILYGVKSRVKPGRGQNHTHAFTYIIKTEL